MYESMYELLNDNNMKVIFILSIILIASLFDFLAGWINALFNKNVPFSSSKAIYGLVRKIMIFILLVIFVPVSALIPPPIGQTAYYILAVGYLVTELYSLASHLGLAQDDKQGQLFHTFLGTLFNKKENNKNESK